MTLINNGAAVNYQSEVVITYTVHCMRCTLIHCQLSKRGADDTFMFIQDGWTPLLTNVSREPKIDVVELLIKHGAQLDIKNEVP